MYYARWIRGSSAAGAGGCDIDARAGPRVVHSEEPLNSKTVDQLFFWLQLRTESPEEEYERLMAIPTAAQDVLRALFVHLSVDWFGHYDRIEDLLALKSVNDCLLQFY